jgi:hypothetical protein
VRQASNSYLFCFCGASGVDFVNFYVFGASSAEFITFYSCWFIRRHIRHMFGASGVKFVVLHGTNSSSSSSSSNSSSTAERTSGCILHNRTPTRSALVSHHLKYDLYGASRKSWHPPATQRFISVPQSHLAPSMGVDLQLCNLQPPHPCRKRHQEGPERTGTPKGTSTSTNTSTSASNIAHQEMGI